MYVCIYACLPACLPACLSVCLTDCLTVCIYLTDCLTVYLPVCLPVCLVSYSPSAMSCVHVKTLISNLFCEPWRLLRIHNDKNYVLEGLTSRVIVSDPLC